MFFYGCKNAVTDSCISCYGVKFELEVYVRRKIYSDTFDLILKAIWVILPVTVLIVQDMQMCTDVCTFLQFYSKNHKSTVVLRTIAGQ